MNHFRRMAVERLELNKFVVYPKTMARLSNRPVITIEDNETSLLLVVTLPGKRGFASIEIDDQGNPKVICR